MGGLATVAAVIVLLVSVWPVSLSGQVASVQTGRALDANYRIGSGRYNTRISAIPDLNSQMYVTGQVTGLGAFRGRTGYVGADQLRMTVPSATLSDFRRQSVGLADVLRGDSYRTSLYLDRSTTALGVREIASGLAIPGGNIPRASLSAPLVPPKVLEDAVADFKPLMGRRPGRAITAQVQPVVQPGGYRTPPDAGARGRNNMGAAVPLAAAPTGVVDIFAVPRLKDRDELARELYEYELAHGRPEQADQRVDAMVDVSQVVRPEVGQEGDQPQALGGQRLEASVADQDVFRDVVFLLQQQHLADAQASEVRPQPAEASREDTALVQAGQRGTIIIKGLAGKGKDYYNKKLRKAGALLKAGKFYSAADEYRIAIIIDPKNPMARLGMALATFAAGEPVTAALHLRVAMEVFPPVMVTRLGVARRIPAEALKRELDMLDERLAGEGRIVDPQLALLAAYMHLGMGNRYRADVSAKKLKAAAGEDKFYLAYADFVLTGERPTTRKATVAPAGTTGTK
jgi:hypothetical protein